MNVAELLHHTFSWEVSPGVAREDDERAGLEELLVSASPSPGS